MGFCVIFHVMYASLRVLSSFTIILKKVYDEKRAGCFVLFAFLVVCD